MQSIGQGAIQRSQPVHSSEITVCICLAAPTIASTGQARKQKVQPMQCASSMTATALGLGWPWAVFSGFGGIFKSVASFSMIELSPGGH